MSAGLTAGLAVLLAFAGGAGPGAAERVPHEPTAVRQLDRARGELRLLREGTGSVRRVVAAYAAVLELHPDASHVVAESQFRLGELHRARGERASAEQAFRLAWSFGGGTQFRARAALELAHLHRRAGAHEAALDAYEAVVHDSRAKRKWRDEADLWAARMHARCGRGEVARRALRRLSATARRAVVRVRAFDRWALAAWEADGERAAREVLARCRRDLARIAAQCTREGEEVRRALARMRVAARLATSDSTR